MGGNSAKFLEITGDQRCPHLPCRQRDQQVIDRTWPVGRLRDNNSVVVIRVHGRAGYRDRGRELVFVGSWGDHNRDATAPKLKRKP